MVDSPYRKPPDPYTFAPPGLYTVIPEEIVLKDHIRLYKNGKLVKSYDVAIKLNGDEGVDAFIVQAMYERPLNFIER